MKTGSLIPILGLQSRYRDCSLCEGLLSALQHGALGLTSLRRLRISRTKRPVVQEIEGTGGKMESAFSLHDGARQAAYGVFRPVGVLGVKVYGTPNEELRIDLKELGTVGLGT